MTEEFSGREMDSHLAYVAVVDRSPDSGTNRLVKSFMQMFGKNIGCYSCQWTLDPEKPSAKTTFIVSDEGLEKGKLTRFAQILSTTKGSPAEVWSPAQAETGGVVSPVSNKGVPDKIKDILENCDRPFTTSVCRLAERRGLVPKFTITLNP